MPPRVYLRVYIAQYTTQGIPKVVYIARYATQGIPKVVYMPGYATRIYLRWCIAQVCLPGTLGERDTVGHTTPVPWWGMYTPVYVPVHPPGYTTVPHGEPGYATRQPGCVRLTALIRLLTERTVSDEPLTDAPPVSLLDVEGVRGHCCPYYARFSQRMRERGRHVAHSPRLFPITRFTVGPCSCCSLLSRPMGITVGFGQRVCLPVNTRFTVGHCFSPLFSSPFWTTF